MAEKRIFLGFLQHTPGILNTDSPWAELDVRFAMSGAKDAISGAPPIEDRIYPSAGFFL